MAGGETWWKPVAACLILAATLLIAPLTSAQPGQTTGKKRLVCWTDDAGNRSCGDAVPARYASKEKKILDQSGRTVKTIPGALTPEQRAARATQAQQAAVTQRAADQQAAHDRALTATYAKPEDLAALRDDRLATIDTRIDITEAAARRDAATLAELRSRMPPAGSRDKPDPALLKNIGQFEASMATSQHTLTDLGRSREQVCNTFSQDIQRFQELKAGTVAFSSPCPPPGSFTRKEAKLDLASARSFFDQWSELERDFDPALLDLYADNAVIKTTRKYPTGEVKNLDLTLEAYRKLAVVALPLAKARLDTNTYSNLKVADDGSGRARVSGTRTSSLKKYSAPFYVVLKPAGESWRIVEEWAESQP